MKLDLNQKGQRMILLLIIAVPVLGIGFTITSLSLQDEKKPAEEVVEKEKEPSLEQQRYESQKDKDYFEVTQMSEEDKEIAKSQDNTSDISKEDLNASKQVAEKFAKAYGNFDRTKPQNVVLNAKPYMSSTFYADWEKNPPRRPLALSKSTIKTIDTYPVDGGDQYQVAWNVVLVEETINAAGDKGTMEEWLWMVLEKKDGTWKVRSLDVNNG